MKIKTLLFVAMLGFMVGGLVSGWTVLKWSEFQESGRLKKALELKDIANAAALVSMQTYYENLPPVEMIETEVNEALKHVPTNNICDVTNGERVMLDYARTGMRDTTQTNNGSVGKPATAAAAGRLPRSVEVRAHADAGIKHQKCYAVAKAVETYLLERSKD